MHLVCTQLGKNLQKTLSCMLKRILSSAENYFFYNQGDDIIEQHLKDTFVDGLVSNDALSPISLHSVSSVRIPSSVNNFQNMLPTIRVFHANQISMCLDPHLH